MCTIRKMGTKYNDPLSTDHTYMYRMSCLCRRFYMYLCLSSLSCRYSPSQHLRRVTVPCYPTIRTTILTQGRWRSGQPPGEPARNNIPVNWEKLLSFSSLIAKGTLMHYDNTDNKELHIPMTVKLHTASLQHIFGDGEWDHARKLAGGNWFACF